VDWGIMECGRNRIEERFNMAFMTVVDAVGVEYTFNTENLILLRDGKSVHELVFKDGLKINLKPEDAAKLKGILISPTA
jgi:hypothetical protein